MDNQKKTTDADELEIRRKVTVEILKERLVEIRPIIIRTIDEVGANETIGFLVAMAWGMAEELKASEEEFLELVRKTQEERRKKKLIVPGG